MNDSLREASAVRAEVLAPSIVLFLYLSYLVTWSHSLSQKAKVIQFKSFINPKLSDVGAKNETLLLTRLKNQALLAH